MSLYAKVLPSLRCKLGEGLHWDSHRNVLWFVDIHGPRVYWFDPDSQRLEFRVMSESVGWVLSIENSERVMVGLKSGIGLFDPSCETSHFEWVDRRFPFDADLRLNDAKADIQGRLWFGSLSDSDESKSVGSLARLDLSTGQLVIVEADYKVANGPAFSADGAIMLHSDSARRLTYLFSMDVATGEIINRCVWKEFAEGDGYPDGMNFDAEGCVWIAHWGSGRLCRYDIGGRRLLTVQLPTPNITNVCFGGKALDRLFVTSASLGCTELQGSADGSAGALFEVFNIGVSGLPSRQLRI